MKNYSCSICGYNYIEKSENQFESLPSNWECPICNASKKAFIVQNENNTIENENIEPTNYSINTNSKDNALSNFSNLEISVICSNLAKGCEKQYLLNESLIFSELADCFKQKTNNIPIENIEKLLSFVNADIENNIQSAMDISSKQKDRGAMRALTWSSKVSLIQKSLLNRYLESGEEFLTDKKIYVCSICGFIHIGNELPDLCPVCKVTNKKFDEIKENN